MCDDTSDRNAVRFFSRVVFVHSIDLYKKSNNQRFIIIMIKPTSFLSQSIVFFKDVYCLLLFFLCFVSVFLFCFLFF